MQGRGVATLGSSRHVPTYNFPKILRKICIKWNAYIFFLFKDFSKIGYKIVIQLDLSSFTAIINATQTAVIDQFIALKNRKMWILSEANQNKIVFSCRILQIFIICSFTNINRVFGQWVLFINYYKLRYNI